MNERPYLYQIIRYVPDLRRMEPQNIGVLVQGQSQLRYQLWTHFRPHFRPGDKRPDFDYLNFRRWREFFEAEVYGPQIALFQPPQNSPEFLEYLQTRCGGNYVVTRPLHVTMRTEDIDEVTEYLYGALVRSPEEPEPAVRVVQRFREELGAKRLDKNRLLRQDEYVDLPNGEAQLFHWQYDRNHGSNERVLIDKIQWMGRIRLTQLELEHVLNAVRKVRAAHFPAHLVVVMDEVEPPSPGKRDATKRTYDNYVEGQKALRVETDEVIARLDESQNLVARIETDLRDAVQ